MKTRQKKILIPLLIGIFITSIVFISSNWLCLTERFKIYEDPPKEIVDLLEDVPSASKYKYQAKEQGGRGLDCLNIIEPVQGNYYGVAHYYNGTSFTSILVHSIDLMNWTYIIDLAWEASMPILHPIPETEGFVLLHEQWQNPNTTGPCWINMKYYSNLSNLISATPQRIYQTPKTLSNLEGTPNIYKIENAGNLIHIGFHFNSESGMDLVANATLHNLISGNITWETEIWNDYNKKLECNGIDGHIGGREYIELKDSRFILQETMLKDDWGSWTPWYYNCDDGGFTKLTIKTHGGSPSITNPHLNIVSDPYNSSKQVVFITYYIQGANNAPGEAGQLIFYKDL